MKYAWSNNAGENEDFEWVCNQEGMGIEFKYTALGIPPENGCVEWKIAIIFNGINAMLNGGKFYYLWEMAYLLKLTA